MLKLNLLNRFRSITFFAGLLLLAIGVFYSCQKTKTGAGTITNPAWKLLDSDRLLSVANVYYTPNEKTVEVWFYETPLVYEFSSASPNAQHNFSVLSRARETNLPVNVRLVKNTGNLIDVVIPATNEQEESFQTEKAKREKAATVPDPFTLDHGAAPNQESATTLVGVVPNLPLLNNIFNTVRNQCCKLAGPYIYGQCIPFQFVADGCYARAHKMRQVIESYYGFTSYKVFNYACNGAGTLSVNAGLWGNSCCVKWWYHVASYVIVQVGTAQNAYLIDPSMFAGAVSIPTWVAAQKNINCGYGGAAQGQVYYTSNAYAPNTLNTATCTLVPYADNTYTAANSTCAAYAPKQGCSF